MTSMICSDIDEMETPEAVRAYLKDLDAMVRTISLYVLLVHGSLRLMYRIMERWIEEFW